ncbi:MAG: hypothetical protein ACRDP3_07030 [Streptomyces sp.]
MGTAFTATHPYMGVPDGPSPSPYGRAHAVPWADITAAALSR